MRLDVVLMCFSVEVHIGNSTWPYGYQKGGFYGADLRKGDGRRYLWMSVDSFCVPGNRRGISCLFNGMLTGAVVSALHKWYRTPWPKNDVLNSGIFNSL